MPNNSINHADEAFALTVQDDGKRVADGTLYMDTRGPDFALVRYGSKSELTFNQRIYLPSGTSPAPLYNDIDFQKGFPL